MARTKNRDTEVFEKNNNVKEDKLLYRVAIYARLSTEDDRKIESNTIENQIALLKQYVEAKEDMVLAECYCDRGISGTCFDRPDFNRLVEDMKKGVFNCLVVKDLSRLGRNYLEAGDYIEKIFPFYDIRFISISDDYDSLYSNPTEDGMIVPLKNLINEAYAKDISLRVGTYKESAQKKGLFIGKAAPFGYLKSKDNNKVLTPDLETKHIVQRIFELRLAGVSSTKIARMLNDEEIDSPMMYRYKKGIDKTDKYANVPWDGSLIKCILSNVAYIGDMEQGYQKGSFYKGIKDHRQKKEKHIYVPNTHEPIISKEAFYKVQELLEESKEKYEKNKCKYEDIKRKEDIFKGIIYCGDCNIKLSFYRRSWKGNTGLHHYYTYLCRNRAYIGNDKCPKKNIKLEVLEDTIRVLIESHVNNLIDKQKVLSELNKTEHFKSKTVNLNMSIKALKEENSVLNARIGNLYGDYQDDIISEQEYLDLKQHFTENKSKNEQKIKQLEDEISFLSENVCVNKQMGEAIENYRLSKELTPEIIKSFISKIIVYAGKRIEVEYVFSDCLNLLEGMIAERRKELDEDGK